MIIVGVGSFLGYINPFKVIFRYIAKKRGHMAELMCVRFSDEENLEWFFKDLTGCEGLA